MPIIRNPFRKQDENLKPVDAEKPVTAAAASKPVGIKEPVEYKLSEISDGGVYLPPSPPERPNTFWSSRSNGSTNSSNPRSVLSADEPFNISRESFDSYRRSFDISARAPIGQSDGRGRPSLDANFAHQPRRSAQFNRPVEPTHEEEFEDVGLNDDKPKKRGFLSRFTDNDDTTPTEAKPPSSHHGFHFSGRKRGQSGQGAELGDMRRSTDIKGGRD